MKKVFNILFFVFLFIAIAGMPVIVASAAPASGPVIQEAEAALPSLADLVRTLETLTGVGLFFAAVANALKTSGWLKDTQAPGASLVLNLFAIIVLVSLQLSGRADLIPIIDANAGVLASIVTGVISLYYQLYVSRKGHESVLAGMPVIGTSYSGRFAGDQVMTALEVDAEV